ncbi:MAG: hypothetical protein ACOCP4_00955 [Candidatus Woesearchaeota archaeon]
MNNCKFFVSPRQTGKTTELIKEASNHAFFNKHVMVITPNETMKKIIYDKIKDWGATKTKVSMIMDNVEIVSVERFFQKKYMDLRKYEKIYIDEYLFFKKANQIDLYKDINLFAGDVDIEIRTSPFEKIDRSLFELVRCIKNNEIDINLNIFSDDTRDKIIYLYYNFLTDVNTNLIVKYDKFKEMLSPEEFDIKYLGKLFKY